jgi:PAS domain S-box-containing protein
MRSTPPDATAAAAALLPHLPAICWGVDRDLRFVAGGGAGLAALGHTPDRLPLDLYSYFRTTDPDHPAIAAHRRALAGETVGYELIWEGRCYQSQVGPGSGAPGDPAVVGVALDITERKREEEGIARSLAMERELRRREQLNLTLLENLPQRIFFKDREGRFVAVNPAFAGDFGLTPEQMVGKSDLDLFPADLAEKYRADDREIMDLRETRTIAERNIVQGHWRYVEVVKTPVLSKRGEPLGVLGLFTDITERQQMEERLQAERELLRTLMDNIPDLIYFKDTQSHFTRVNIAQATNLGLASPEEAVGKSDFDFYPEELARTFFADEQEIVKTGRAVVNKIELQSAPGEPESWLASTKVPVYDSEGRVGGIVGVSRDVTERVRAEAELKRAAEELARSNEELEQFAYVASHDLQEPLRMIASYTQLLQRRYRGKLGEDADEFIGFAVDGATRMQGLINDLLEYSRVGTRAKPFERVPLDEVVDRAVLNLGAAIEEQGAAVTYGPLPTIEGDPTQLTQLFQNLIGNAVKFRGEEPPRVHVAARREDGEWVLSVRDNGIGIDPEYAERIFVIFQRLHGKTEYPGSGIGLAICKKIVHRHGGRIWVESREGAGATFCFTLPEPKRRGSRHPITQPESNQ